MAPKKVWVTPSELTVLLAEKRNTYDIAYIRKDIVDEAIKTAKDHAYFAGQEKLRERLLEWAKAVKADPMLPMNIDEVIEKIESL